MKFLSILCLAASCFSAHAALVEKAVVYQADGVLCEGFHVYDDALQGKRPAVLVIHQWLGLTDYEKDRSRQLAAMGYNVLAADIYGQGIRLDPANAAPVANQYKQDRKLYRIRLDAALSQLSKDERTDVSRIAAIGYCFGGTGALELARAGKDIAGVVSFHGGLDSQAGMQAQAGKIPAKVLILHGGSDPFVKPAELAALEKEMTDAKADWQLITYGGAVHGFTSKSYGNDPSKGVAYDEAADRRSWEAMQTFFAEIFKKS